MYVYIGSPRMEGDIEYDGSPFGTPFSVPKDGDSAVAIWMKYLHHITRECGEIFDQAQELDQTVLVCDCESGRWCHGTIVAGVANGHLQFEGAVSA